MIKSSVVSIILVFTAVIVNARKTRWVNYCPPEIDCHTECQNSTDLWFLGMSCRRGKLQDRYLKRYLHLCEYYDTSSERGRRYFLQSLEKEIGTLDQRSKESFAPKNSSECKTATEAMILLRLRSTWKYDSCCACSGSRFDHRDRDHRGMDHRGRYRDDEDKEPHGLDNDCRNPDSDFQKYLNPTNSDLPKLIDPCSRIDCKVECMDYRALWLLGDACSDGEHRINRYNQECEHYETFRWPRIKSRLRISNGNLAAPKDEAECKKYAEATYLHVLKTTWKYDSCCECGAKTLDLRYKHHASNLDDDCKDPNKEFQKFLSQPMPITWLKFDREHNVCFYHRGNRNRCNREHRDRDDRGRRDRDDFERRDRDDFERRDRYDRD